MDFAKSAPFKSYGVICVSQGPQTVSSTVLHKSATCTV